MEPRFPWQLAGLFLFLTMPVTSPAPVAPYTWSGLGASDNATDAGNWTGGVAPTFTGGSELLTFTGGGRNYVLLPAGDINGLVLTGSHSFSTGGNINVLGLEGGGLAFTASQPAQVTFSNLVRLDLAANQTWQIGADAHLRLDQNTSISGAGTMTKTGAGTIEFGRNNFDWSGGLVFNEGRLIVKALGSGGVQANSLSLGTGPVVIGPAPGDLSLTPTFEARSEFIGSAGFPLAVQLHNAITLNGIFASHNQDRLNLTNTITLNSDSTIRSNGEQLTIFGALKDGPTGAAAPRKVTIDGSSVVFFRQGDAAVSGGYYTGGTHVQNGRLVFQEAASVPDTGQITVSSDGYVGYASPTGVQSEFLARLSPANVAGTVGFDLAAYFGSTAPLVLAPETFTDAINLTGFHASAKLGSASKAILTGAITPQGAGFRFGGGGGFLQVDSVLDGARSLVVDSPAALPLTVRLTNSTNSYSDVTTVVNSALVFGLGAFGSHPSRSISISPGAYVGNESTTTTFLLDRVTLGSTGGMIGFDKAGLNDTSSGLVITDNISLAGFSNPLWLGTASFQADAVQGRLPGLTLSGTLTPQGTTYRLGAYKGGFLMVNSTLGGVGNSVHIGDPDSLGTIGDLTNKVYSTVLLNGDNTYGGGTILSAGELRVGQSNGIVGTAATTALGSASLTVAPHNLSIPGAGDDDGPIPLLTANAANLIVPNPIVLNTDLAVGGTHSLELSGNISGSGALRLGEKTNTSYDLTLAGANTFSGGLIFEKRIDVLLASNTGLGAGPVVFDNATGTVEFASTATAVVINGLRTNGNGYGAFYLDGSVSTTVTVNQASDAAFAGEFYSYGPGRLIKNGPGTITSNDGYIQFDQGTPEATLSGSPQISVQINQGGLTLGSDFSGYDGYPTTPTWWVHGGILTLKDSYLENPVIVDSGGRFAGHGAYLSADIGAGGILAPGVSGEGNIGQFQFDSRLSLAPGGAYEWNLARNDGFFSDHIQVGGAGTLDITATTADKFTLKAITLGTDGNPGIMNGLAPGDNYSWMLMSALNISGYDPAAFALDVTLFHTNLGTGNAIGTYTLSLAGENTQLMLNLSTFAGIPEPSTYALLALGLGFIGLTAWRRRHAS